MKKNPRNPKNPKIVYLIKTPTISPNLVQAQNTELEVFEFTYNYEHNTKCLRYNQRLDCWDNKAIGRNFDRTMFKGYAVNSTAKYDISPKSVQKYLGFNSFNLAVISKVKLNEQLLKYIQEQIKVIEETHKNNIPYPHLLMEEMKTLCPEHLI